MPRRHGTGHGDASTPERDDRRDKVPAKNAGTDHRQQGARGPGPAQDDSRHLGLGRGRGHGFGPGGNAARSFGRGPGRGRARG
jgi:hypothetical protein